MSLATAPAVITELAFATRISLRTVDPASLGVGLGLAVPTKIGTRTVVGARSVLCLGPDEWLVEAREAARPANAGLTVMHADFGQVSLHFGQDNGNLTVSLASNDPGFLPAVTAAAATADASANNDAGAPGNRRDEGGHAARSPAEAWENCSARSRACARPSGRGMAITSTT